MNAIPLDLSNQIPTRSIANLFWISWQHAKPTILYEVISLRIQEV